MQKNFLFTLFILIQFLKINAQTRDVTAIIHENSINKLFISIGDIKGSSEYSFMLIDGSYDWLLMNPQIKLHQNKADFIADVKVTAGKLSYKTKISGKVEICYEPTTNLVYVEITEALFPLNILFFGKEKHLWDVNLKKYFPTPFTFEGPLSMGTEMIFTMPDNSVKKIYAYPVNCGVKVAEKQIIVFAEMDFISR